MQGSEALDEFDRLSPVYGKLRRHSQPMQNVAGHVAIGIVVIDDQHAAE
jgi:hypothetical protein